MIWMCLYVGEIICINKSYLKFFKCMQIICINNCYLKAFEFMQIICIHNSYLKLLEVVPGVQSLMCGTAIS